MEYYVHFLALFHHNVDIPYLVSQNQTQLMGHRRIHYNDTSDIDNEDEVIPDIVAVKEEPTEPREPTT